MVVQQNVVRKKELPFVFISKYYKIGSTVYISTLRLFVQSTPLNLQKSFVHTHNVFPEYMFRYAPLILHSNTLKTNTLYLVHSYNMLFDTAFPDHKQVEFRTALHNALDALVL